MCNGTEIKSFIVGGVYSETSLNQILLTSNIF